MNADQLGQLMSAWVKSVPRMPDAACRGNPGPFDLDVKCSREAIDAAIEMCLSCPAMVACAAWVDSLPADQRPRGVCGGRLWDPDAPKTAREMMAAERKAVAPPTMPRPHSP
ncbi:hypothetical protein, partial [Mycobacterium intracellulare]|uniref:hypothetical protein n=1 Tax=Mycobacterium intracellulare TaxID=1767 RepID=UPI0013E09696